MNSTPKLQDLNAVLFDFDGVVVQSEDVYDRSTIKLGQHFGVRIPEDFFDANRGVSEAVFYERFKSRFKLTIPLAELMDVGRQILWHEFTASVTYTPGFQSFFSKVKSGVPHVALVTATPRALIEEIFQNSKIDIEFDHIITATDVTNTKPHPEPYTKMCTLLGVDPARTLVIEDSPPGLRSASAAGCQTIGITTSCAGEALKEANFVVDSFGELEELLTIV